MDYFKTYRDTLRLVRGNDFATVNNIVAKYPDDTEVEGFDLNVCTDLGVRIKRDSSSFKDIETYAETWFILEPKKIRINFDGLKMKNGSYRIEFFGKFQGKDWRCYSEDKGFGIVESNEEANIPAETIIADGVYQILTDFTMTYQTQEQADWDETDDTLPSYIKNKPELFSGVYDDLENKPDLSLYVEKVDGKGLSENDYTDEDKQKVANAVTRTVADLANYYLKSETYTQNEVNELIASIENFHYEIYPNISYIASPLSNVLYLIGPIGNGSDRYEEYVYYNDTFVKIGDTSIDLSGYVTSFELSEALTGYVLQSSLASILSDYQEKLFSGINIKTINEQSILGEGNIEIQGGGGGAIDSISVNGTPQTIDENKNVDITMPTKVSDLDNDSGFITGYTETDPVFVASAAHGISSSDISNWNAKGTYSKPSGGIPSTDMTEAVQTSLGKADTALQSFTEIDPTVPSWAKASSKPSYTASEVGAVPTTRTVNGKALSADITLSASDVNALPSSTVIPDAQIQSDWSQADNAKKDYIKNKPTIPAAQVQANWNESDTDSKAYIQNKPTIPAAQVQSNWNESDTNSKAYIQNKPTIPAAGIPSGGNAGQVLTKTDGSTDYAVAWRDTNNIFPSAYCTTAAATAAKNASCTFWTATANSYLHILITKANSNQGALTLNVNSTGAKPIYINGTVSSSTNYTLPAGSYLVFYDGTNYYFRTDGKLTANITGTADGSANVIETVKVNGTALTPDANKAVDVKTNPAVVSHGTSDTTFAVTPNVLHIWGTVASLTLTLATPADNTIVNLCMFEFTSGSTATTLSLPSSITWEKGVAPTIEADTIYEITIQNNRAKFSEFPTT